MKNTAATISIRPATPADAEPIAAIYAHYVLHSSISFELQAPSTTIIAERIQTLISQRLPYLVAENAHEIVGYAYANPWKLRMAYCYSVENSVYVALDWQRQRIGKTLLETLIQRCQAIGKKQMVAVITGTDKDASISLHQGLGFRKVGILHDIGYKFDRWHDTVLMQRAL